MTQETVMSATQLKAWDELMHKAISHSIASLSDMAGREISVSSIRPIRMEVKDIPDHLGGAALVAVGVLLSVENEPGFHMALMHSPETAYAIIDILLDQPSGTTTELGELELSTLGEMGNIMCSFFLNILGDTTKIELRATPPTVRMDMTGAVRDYILAEIMMESDEVSLMETTYGTSERKVDGTFVVIPCAEFKAAVAEKWGDA